jgi:hypothetical protein
MFIWRERRPIGKKDQFHILRVPLFFCNCDWAACMITSTMPSLHVRRLDSQTKTSNWIITKHHRILFHVGEDLLRRRISLKCSAILAGSITSGKTPMRKAQVQGGAPNWRSTVRAVDFPFRPRTYHFRSRATFPFPLAFLLSLSGQLSSCCSQK